MRLLEMIVVFIVLIVSVFVVTTDFNKLDFKTGSFSAIDATYSLEEYATDVLEKCSSQPWHPSCYDKEIPKLTDFISMEEAFEVTRIVQAKDPSYRYCHVLGHELSAKEYHKDPENWKDIPKRCPSDICANGCQHGVLFEHFGNEVLSDEELEEFKHITSTVCEKTLTWHPTLKLQRVCYHGLGHLTMYATNADIPKSLEMCDAISLKEDGTDFRHNCYSGLFMQMFQPLEPEDFALVEGKVPAKEEAKEFCGNVLGDNLRKEDCWLQAWPLFQEEIKTPEGIIRFCEEGKSFTRRDKCYSHSFGLEPKLVGYDITYLKEFCGEFDDELKRECMLRVAPTVIDGGVDFTNLAVDFCNSLKEENWDDECYESIISFSLDKFDKGSKIFLRVCSFLPEMWKKKCIETEVSSFRFPLHDPHHPFEDLLTARN